MSKSLWEASVLSRCDESRKKTNGKENRKKVD